MEYLIAFWLLAFILLLGLGSYSINRSCLDANTCFVGEIHSSVVNYTFYQHPNHTSPAVAIRPVHTQWVLCNTSIDQINQYQPGEIVHAIYFSHADATHPHCSVKLQRYRQRWTDGWAAVSIAIVLFCCFFCAFVAAAYELHQEKRGT